tara:strand:+ start:15786 stop:16316 length:531 start_codon:yes stop_codon:yes gene_type:complete
MNDIPRLNIDDLYETKQKNDIKKVTVFNNLLNKIHQKIKIASRQKKNNEFCYFVMPEILVGYPNYDFTQCLLYVTSCLENDGFLTKYIHPNLILISWRHIVPKYVREQIFEKTGKKVDKFGKELSEPSITSNKLLTDTTSSSTKSLNTDSNKSKTYKPSGKFIYDKDLLKKIEEIL